MPNRRSYTTLVAANILLIVLGQVNTRGAINAASASLADVSSAISRAADGDTVMIPPGTAIWNSTLRITKNISLIGGGVGQTVITDEIPRNGSGNIALFQLFPSSHTVLCRVSGFTFKGSSNPIYQVQDTGSQATVRISCVSSVPNVRIDHCYFNDLYARNVQFYGSVMGVVDHCTFDKTETHWGGCIDVQHNTWKGVGAWGDNSWADDTNFGTRQAVFIEDCSFTNFSAATCLDSEAGGRMVFRHNTVNHCNIGNHGTETSGRARGGRTFEIYNNTFNSPFGNSQSHEESCWMVYIRSGAALVFNNTIDHFDSICVTAAYRMHDSSTPCWRAATGTNPWDVNDAALYDSGTHTGSNGATVLADSTKTWTTSPPQWRNLTDGAFVLLDTTTGHSSEIVSNTNNTITVAGQTQGPPMVFNHGDSYEIRKVTAVLDSPGHGKGNYISGGNDNLPATPTGWPNDALEPIRVWSNSLTDRRNGLPAVYSQSAVIRPNREFYYSSDSSAALSGYTPYTYPHPLVTSGGHGPQTPGDLHVLR